MADRITIVTPPDDVELDGVRILLVDLTQAQSDLLSQALHLLPPGIDVSGIIYSWNTDDDIHWLLTVKHKCDIIIFNAESSNDLVVGYMAAQPNSYYLGTLKMLSDVNKSAIYDVDQAFNLLERLISKYAIR